jgi:cytochrome P450
MERLRREWLGFLTWCAREYGDVVDISFANMHIYLLNHPASVEHVLVKHNRDFVKDIALRSSQHIFGNGLLTSDGDYWRSQRRLLQPGFHRERIAAYAATVVDCGERLLGTWRPGALCDVHADMTQLTLEIVARTLFSIARPEEIDLDRLDQFTFAAIAERRASSHWPNDLLSMLLLAEDADGTPLTDQQVRDEVVTMFLAGHETTASSLSWTWYLVAQHPEVEARLLEELETVLGAGGALRRPTIADISCLRYTEMVIKESLRLYPSIWGFGREALYDCEIDGFFVPAGTTLFMSEWVIHRDPRYFEQPEQFNPDRWADASTKSLPKFAYFPFGGGPRLCIGNTLAMTQAILLLATIAPHFRLIDIPDQVVEPWPALTLSPKDGIKLRLARR